MDGLPRCQRGARAATLFSAVASPDPTPSPQAGELPLAGLLAWLSALTAFGLYQRLVVPGPPATLAPTDAYYYGRLAWLSRLAFPRPVTFDSFVAFPGMEVPWPPGHAWLLGLFHWLWGATSPFSERGLAALSWAGPVLSLAGIAVLCAIAARWSGRWAALVVAGTLLVQPWVSDTGQLGEADHHVHEVFFGAALALGFALAVRRRVPALRAGAALGLVAGLPYLFTSSGFLFLPPLAAVALSARLLRRQPRYRVTVVLLAAAAVSLLVVVVAAASMGRLSSSDYYRLSGFHVSLHALLLAAAGALLLRAPSRRLRLTALVASAAGLLAFAPGSLGFAGECVRALGHLGRSSAILSEAVESLPLLWDASGFTLQRASTLTLALPLLLAAALLPLRRQPVPAWLTPLAGWFALLLAITLAQSRFTRPLLGVAAVLAGLLAQRAAAEPRRSASALAARLAAAVLILPPPEALVPSTSESRFVQGVEPALAFLRTSTPDPGGLWDPRQAPAWGVLSDWSVGHLIVTRGERPALASPFGQVAEAEAAAEQARAIFHLPDPASAARSCRQRALRYALTYDPLPFSEKPPRTVRGMLARGMVVPGFKQIFVDTQADRVTRVFEIVEP